MYDSNQIPSRDCARARTGVGWRLRVASFAGIALATSAVLACAASPACRKGPADDVRMAGHTTGEAVKAGVTTGVAGVKAGGRAVGGYVAGGSDEASEKWEAGKRDTKDKANTGAAETESEASLPECED